MSYLKSSPRRTVPIRSGYHWTDRQLQGTNIMNLWAREKYGHFYHHLHCKETQPRRLRSIDDVDLYPHNLSSQVCETTGRKSMTTYFPLCKTDMVDVLQQTLKGFCEPIVLLVDIIHLRSTFHRRFVVEKIKDNPKETNRRRTCVRFLLPCPFLFSATFLKVNMAQGILKSKRAPFSFRPLAELENCPQ